MKKILRSKIQGRKGSVLIVSIILMTIAGFATLTWLSFLTETQRQAIRDRDRHHAFYAAEAGVELVVDFFNNPQNYRGGIPFEYLEFASHPAAYPLKHPDLAPYEYGLFDPFIVDYVINDDGHPVFGDDGNLAITRMTWFRNLEA